MAFDESKWVTGGPSQTEPMTDPPTTIECTHVSAGQAGALCSKCAPLLRVALAQAEEELGLRTAQRDTAAGHVNRLIGLRQEAEAERDSSIEGQNTILEQLTRVETERDQYKELLGM